MARPDALSEVKLAFHCPADWKTMSGDERVRHCSLCERNVYNISGMSRDEAVKFIEGTGGKVCLRFYRRADGTILTQPCGAIKRRLFKARVLISTFATAIGLVVVFPALAMPAYAGARAMPVHDRLDSLLRRMSALRMELAEAKTPEDREAIRQMLEVYRIDIDRIRKDMTAEEWKHLGEKACEKFESN